MKGDGLAKHYDKLSLDELFRLRLHALARRDLVECERLDRACPPLRYREYCARLEASDVLMLGTLVELLPKLAKLELVGAFRPLVEHLEGAATDAGWLGYLDGYAAGWKAAGKRGEPPDVPDKKLTAASRQDATVGTSWASQVARTSVEEQTMPNVSASVTSPTSWRACVPVAVQSLRVMTSNSSWKASREVLLTHTSVVRPPTRTVWMPRLRKSASSDDPWNEL